MTGEGWIVAAVILTMAGALAGYLIFLYGSKERSEKIEKRGMIPFSDEPVEAIHRNSNREKKHVERTP